MTKLTRQSTHDLITAEFTTFKRMQSTRAERMQFAGDLAERYYVEHGKHPETTILDRLATLILQDELAEKHPDKMTRNEYPLLSADQAKVRYDDERSLQAAQDVAVDGVDYRIKSRDSNRRMREVYGG